MKTDFGGRLRPTLLAAALGVAAPAFLPMAARAQETPPIAVPAAPPAAAPTAPAKVDPEARALLDQMAKAHQVLTAFSATMDFSVLQNDSTVKQQAKIAFQKPNKARISTNNPTDGAAVAAVSDGTFVFHTNSSEKNSYHKSAAAPDVKAIAQVFKESDAAGIGFFPMLTTQADVSNEILPPGVTSLIHGPDETVGGVLCDVVSASFGPTPDKRVSLVFTIGKTDHLLRRLSLTQYNGSAQQLALSETYSDVRVNPDLPPATFAFVPVPGMKEIKDDAPAAPAGRPQVRLKKGGAPLPFSASDLAGEPVSLAAYKGKVVLLDFWATWCPPCREEVPNIVRTYNKYHAAGFEIVGVSLDRAGDKAKLISYTKEFKMPWRQIFDAANGSNAVSTAYGVQTIPFAVLIGRDGKVLAIGDSLRGDALEPAIKAALAGK